MVRAPSGSRIGMDGRGGQVSYKVLVKVSARPLRTDAKARFAGSSDADR